MNTSNIWDDFVSNNDDYDDDDDIPVKQDYDLDNLYSKEQVEIEEQTDSMSEDDDNVNDMVGTVETSCISNRRTQVEMIYWFCMYYL
jgi:hypothetical protein